MAVTMDITLVSEKGGPLTITEADTNFRDLRDAVLDIDARVTSAVTGIRWLGVYDPTASYEQGDGVTHLGRTYVASAATSGNAPTDEEFWEPVGAGFAATDALVYSLIFG